jgi:BASS family bile acid:Na+ symporter
MVGPLEQAILALMIAVIMLGMGASLTPRDFTSALKRPYGLGIGLVSQYGFMPLIAFTLAMTLPVSEPVKIGLLIMGCMPGGTTSNIFTYFSKGNLALSVLMTVTSTLFGVVLIPILLLVYAAGLDIDIPVAVENKLALNARKYPADQVRGSAAKRPSPGGS